MADVETDVKKWGNSLGIRLPRSVLKAEGIGPGDRVHVRVEKAAGGNPDAWGYLLRLPGKRKRLSFAEFRRSEREREARHEGRLGLR